MSKQRQRKKTNLFSVFLIFLLLLLLISGIRYLFKDDSPAEKEIPVTDIIIDEENIIF